MDPRLVPLFLLLLLLALADSAPPTTPAPSEDMVKALQYLAECKTELKLSEADISALQKKAPFSQKTKCLIKCVAQKFELMVAGKLNEKEVMEWIEEERKDNATQAQLELQMYNTCKNTLGNDDCDRAGKYFICSRDFAEKNRMIFSF